MKPALRILVFSVLIFTACNRDKSTHAEQEVAVDMIQMAPPQVAGNSKNDAVFVNKITADTAKKIIKTGDISFETADITSTRKTIITVTKKHGGYISGENESGYENGRKDYKLNLKVPAKNFDALLQEISSAAGQIDSKNIQISDITTEYIDTKTRLQNKRLLEKRYLELLNKASRISDMLAIEDKLSEIRSDIESVEGQFLHMQKQVAYSSLDLTFYSKRTAQETGKGFFYKLGRSLVHGWDFMLSLFLGLLSFWPLVIIATLFLIWLRRYKKRKQPSLD